VSDPREDTQSYWLPTFVGNVAIGIIITSKDVFAGRFGVTDGIAT